MINDKRYIRCRQLAEIFEEYLIMDNARDYLEATIKEDAPQISKDAYREYIKLKKEIREDIEKLPFM